MSKEINDKIADWCGLEYRSDGAGNWCYWDKETGMPHPGVTEEFTDSRDACALMEAEIRKHGLWTPYCNFLSRIRTKKALETGRFLFDVVEWIVGYEPMDAVEAWEKTTLDCKES